MSWLTVTVVDKAPPAFWPSLMQYLLYNISSSHVHYMRFIVGSNAFSFNLTGADGNSAGGQLAGSQHYAEDGPTCLICSLATLQRQVYSHPHPQVIHYMHNVLGTVYIHVSFLPVCSGSNIRQKGSCARWLGSRCPNLTGETGGSRGRVWHKWGCLEKQEIAWITNQMYCLITFLSYYFLLRSSCSMSPFFSCQ